MIAGTRSDGITQIVARFEHWVKDLCDQLGQIQDEQDVQHLEEQVRDQGREVLRSLLENLMREVIDRRQEQARTCPHCHGRRRHQGVRPRKLVTSVGALSLQGIYWKCPGCGLGGHTAQAIAPETMSRLMRGLVCLLGASLSSFAKGEVVARRVLGVAVDDETIRRRCLQQGQALARVADDPPPQVKEGQDVLGSCDGTMVRTRQAGWREVKGYRFEHEGGRYGGAYLEPAESFLPRVKRAAQRIGADRARRRTFLSDMAQWICQGVAEHLPEWSHHGDYWHACQHVTPMGHAIYGAEHPRAKKFNAYWCRRLKRYGAAVTADRLRRIVMHCRKVAHQEAVLVLIRFLDKHVQRMDFPTYQAQGLPIGSGPMESFCNQLGLRMKGPGKRWSVSNVTPMAMLVSRWSLEGEGAWAFAGSPAAA